MKDSVRAYVAGHADAWLADLMQWLRIPSLSGDPARVADVRRSAEWLAGALRRTGFPVVEVWETMGHPTVFAEWPSGDPSAPTAVVYGHHDVQPVDPVALWQNPPFEPEVRGERLCARGAADDKGQVFFHTLGVRAHLAATGRGTPAVNLKLIVEGEEESGSPHFADLLREKRDRLACDVVVVSDTGVWSRETPTTCTAMRGLTDGQVDFYGPGEDIHSGAFGGAVPNPLTELCRVLAQLHDHDRRVTIPGFYDDVIPLTDLERQQFADLPYDEHEWLRNAKSAAAAGEAGYTTLERVWGRPTAELNGLWGGHTGPGTKTIIPAEAHAKVSFRLVAYQEPAKVQEAFRAWIAERTPAGIRSTVTFYGPGVRPCLTPIDHPAVRSLTRAMAKAYDSEIGFTREGGSGPEADLQDVLAAPVVFLGVSLPDDGWHGPNEKAEIPLLLRGAEAAAYLWSDLAETLRR
jgi:acetylornithine deacetylase/succinyl-diaminopimelate desuccinylase-like protein